MSVSDISVCGCIVLEREQDWPVDEGLWQTVDHICDSWLIVAGEGVKSILLDTEIGAESPDSSKGRFIRCQRGQDPYQQCILAARDQASHLWLISSTSVVLAPPLFAFGDLSDSHYIAHGFSDQQLEWRRTLISTGRDWRYSFEEQQWVPEKGGCRSGYLQQPKIHVSLSGPMLLQENTARKAMLLDAIEGRTPTALECSRIARCFEVLDDKISASSWYHRGTQVSQAGEDVYAYCSYRYWFLLKNLSAEGSSEDWYHRWLEVYENWQERAEPLYELIQLLVEEQEWDKAWSLLEIALEIQYPNDQLPYEGWIYEYGLRQVAARIAHVRGDDENVLTHTVAAMGYIHLPADTKLQLNDWQAEAYERLNQGLAISREEKNRFVVIVPFRNCADFLQACIDSLKVQTYRDFEAVFVDDVSSDGGLSSCDLAGLPAYTIIRREERMEALGNQLDVLLNYCDPSDIAVFLDGDDRLANESVLEYLNTVYNQTGCWVTYGQSVFNDTDETGNARPILPVETKESLFKRHGFRFPIHLRSHRVGLMHVLKEQDPQFECLKRTDGRLIQRASDVAHMRAMLMLAPWDRIRFISRPLYKYNTHNPGSHFQSPGKTEQLEESRFIGSKQSLKTADSYSPFVLKHQQKTRLLTILIPGSNLDIIQSMMREGDLKHIRSMSDIDEIVEFSPQKGLGNYAFLRQIMCGETPSQYRDMGRYIPRRNGYSYAGYNRPHMMTGTFFAEGDILDGAHYLIAGTSEVNFRTMQGLTMINQWMCHGKNASTLIYPEALKEAISSDTRFDPFEKTLERTSFADIEDAKQILATLSERMDLKLEVYSRLLARGDWDGVFLGIDELHDVGHLLWHFWDRSHPHYREEYEPVAELIKDIHRQADRMIGALLKQAGPVPAVLVGGPGMQTNGSLNTWLGHILRLFEEAYTGDEVPEYAQARNRFFYVQYTDPSGGGIRFNLVGREPNGKVTEERYEEACEYLVEQLLQIRNLRTGLPVLREVYVSREHYGVERDSGFPDLLCVWEPGSAYGSIHSELLGTMELEPDPHNVLDFRTGDHSGVAWAVLNKRAREYYPQDRQVEPYEMGEFFRKIVSNFPDGAD